VVTVPAEEDTQEAQLMP
jgi:hypothetical protein